MSMHGPLLAIAAFTLLNVWEGAIKGCTQAIEKDGAGAIEKISVRKPADLQSGNIEKAHREGLGHKVGEEAVRHGLEDLVKHPNDDDKRKDGRTR